MKNLIIIILASILVTSCNKSPKEKAQKEALDKIRSEAYASMYSMPSIDTASKEVDLIDFKKIPSIHRIMDSNTSHIFIGQIKEKGGYEWLIHDPDCPKCLLR